MEIFYISLCQLPLSLTLCITMKIHPCQVFTHKDLPEPSHFWAEQSQLSQPLLLCQMLQTCNHLCGILLDPRTRDPRSGPSTPVTSHQGKLEGKGHLTRCADSALPNALQDTVGFLCFRSPLPSDVNLGPSKSSRVFFARLFCNSLVPAWGGAWAGLDISLSSAPGGSGHSFL